MKNETKKEASNANLETSLASEHNMSTYIADIIQFSIPIATTFHCVCEEA